MPYTLSLHDALPIYLGRQQRRDLPDVEDVVVGVEVRIRHVEDVAIGLLWMCAHGEPGLVEEASGQRAAKAAEAVRLEAGRRSEEHTSELQSRLHLVCPTHFPYTTLFRSISVGSSDGISPT